MSEIEYLYRYTSIESLALMLKSKAVRLNPLDKMDDLQEQKTSDVENLGKFVFISSWTEDDTESIPMWRMYTNPQSGVRIKMRKNPFVWHGTAAKDIIETLRMPAGEESISTERINTFLDFSKLMANGYFSPQAWGGEILERVTYTDDIERLEPSVAHTSKDGIRIEVGKMGKYKSSYWAFQKEWRYIMTFLPLDFKCGVETMAEKFTSTVNNLMNGIESPPFRFYNLDIAPERFKEMEITLSPQMTDGNRILLEALVEKYNSSAIIWESELLGKI